jgi:hypothetical protein
MHGPRMRDDVGVAQRADRRAPHRRTGAAAPMTTQRSADRAELMAQHTEARHRRDTAELDSPEYRAACEDIARLEAAISAVWEATAPKAG